MKQIQDRSSVRRSPAGRAGEDSPRTLIDRRHVVGGAVAAGALAATSTAQGVTVGPVVVAGPALSPPRLARRELSLVLLQRASFGATEAELAEVRAMGLEAWVDWQLQPQLIPDSALDARLSVYDWRNMTAQQMVDHPTLEVWEIAHENQGARLLRARYSRRQLYERIVEFWSDHFNIFGQADGVHDLKVVDDRDVIRPHALGKFRDLLRASAKSPAMIAYLDNDNNVVGAPNENYSREVMELHTLGVDGPYTENDVRELARCFTGWSYRYEWENGQYGVFLFRSGDHDYGAKSLLGLDIPAGGGVTDAETVLDFLANHPATALHVVTKLARWLLGYEPPSGAIAAARATWGATDGSIREVVRTLLQPKWLQRATPKLKRPMHWYLSLLRATGVDLPRPGDTIWEIDFLGQIPFGWGPPNGYPDALPAWGGLLLPRWQLAARYGQGWTWSTDQTTSDWVPLLGSVPKSQWVRRLDQALCGGAMTRAEAAAIQRYLDLTFSSATSQARGEAIELVASSPSFLFY